MAEEKKRVKPSSRGGGAVTLPEIDDAWARRTLDVARAQAALPDSPGRHSSSGAVALCAAACLAVAGLEIHYGAEYAAAFRAEVGATGSKRPVMDAFERLGLGRGACAALMHMNDRTAPADRVAALAGLLTDKCARSDAGAEL